MNLASLRLGLLIIFKLIKRNIWWVLLVVSILAILITAQLKLNLFYSSNYLRIGLIGTYQEHDLPLEMTKIVSEGLVKADSQGRMKPNLVSSWEINNDATIFKFKLRDGVKWVDNTPLQAKDLEFNIPNTEVSFPDDKTIQFKLKEPYSPFPSLLTKPIFKKGTLLGIGPYRIAKVEKSRIFITKITLIPSDSKLPIVYVRFYPNEKVAITGFNLGEVETLIGFSNPKLSSDNPLISVKQTIDYSKIVTILYSMSDSLVGGKNRSLRQALSYITPQIKGEEVADNPYPKTSWAYDKTAKKYLSSPTEAKAALERAKSQMGEDKLHSEIILTSTSNLEDVGKVVVEAWKSLGFKAKLRVESGIPQNFQALLITQSIPTDPDQYFLWHATQAKTNLTKYDSKRVDKDLEDGRNGKEVITEDERKSKYFDFQRSLLEDAPATFLYFPKYNIVYLKKAENLLDKVIKLKSK